MIATRRAGDAAAAWQMLQTAHAVAMSYGRSKTAATEYLDRLLRTARSWGIWDIGKFLDIEINHRRMGVEEARRLCGWRPS